MNPDKFIPKGVLEEGIEDPNEVLDGTFLTPLAEHLKAFSYEGTKLNNYLASLDEAGEDSFTKLKKWHERFNLAYSYKGRSDNDLEKWERDLKKKIESNKESLDLMGLVEIASLRLIEFFAIKKYQGADLKLRKTTETDDFLSGIDFILELPDGKKIGIDLTLSENNSVLERKRLKKTSQPNDYIYYKSKKGESVGEIPRVILQLNKELAYFFTQNYFDFVLEKCDILDDEDVGKVFDYALDDYLESKVPKKEKLEQLEKKIFSIIEEGRDSFEKLIKTKV